MMEKFYLLLNANAVIILTTARVISMLAGDGAGLSRDIVNAAATGVIAGRGILKKVG